MRTTLRAAVAVATGLLPLVFVGAVTARASAASTFTYSVDSVGDARDTNLNDGSCDAPCTLRGALEQANHNCAGAPTTSTTIDFAIPGSGVRTISPVNNPNAGTQSHAAPLPGIVCPVTIDATTQGGLGYAGPPLVELDGSNATTAGQQGPGLGFGGNTSGSTIRGLVINRWLGPGLKLAGPGGGTSYAFVVTGNYIGTDSTSQVALPNGSFDGIAVSGNASVTIGGTHPGDANVVSGSGGRGIAFGPGAASGSVVEGNFVGTDATGTLAVPNTSDGILLNGNSGARIGGTTPAAKNVISGNHGDGVDISGATVGGFTIQGNLIGTKANGTTALTNTGFGVSFQGGGGGDLLGGVAPGAGNVIAFNGKAGVQVGVGTGHHISANAIFDNTGLAIDLTPCSNGACPGPNINDVGDGDTGANQFQNFPVIASTKSTSTATTIKGTLNSAASESFTIEAFASPSCDASGYGEAKQFLAAKSVITSKSSNAGFTLTVSPPVPKGWSVTATASDSAANTSELSPCRGPLTVSPARAAPGAVVTLSGKNFGTPAGQTVTLIWKCPLSSCSTGTTTLGTVVTGSSGGFKGTSVTIPTSASPGSYWIGARSAAVFATVPFTVS